MKKYFISIFIIPGVIALLIGLILSLKDTGGTPPPADSWKIVDLHDGDRFELTAGYVTKTIDGKAHTMLAYNGSIPGPTLRVTQGDTVLITFTNNSGMDTLLHPHGVRAENAYDGTHRTQDPIKPGETFEYRLNFPDPGVFAYHPHIREDFQQDMGLAANFIVVPKDVNYWTPVNKEEVIMLDDILIEDDELAPHSPDFATHALMGRYGNTMLVNGETGGKQSVSQGEVVRYYITNAANTRTFALTLPGARMKLEGGDNGRYEREQFVERVVLGPLERAVIDVYWELPKTYTFMHDPGGGEKTYPLFSVTVGGEAATKTSYRDQFQALRSGDEYGKSLASYRSYIGMAPTKEIVFTVETDMANMSGMGGMSADGHDRSGMGMMDGGMMAHHHPPVPIEWEDQMGMMNVYSTDKTTKWIIRDMTEANQIGTSTGVLLKDNDEINWIFKKGEMVKIRVVNDPKSPHPMQHPFHIHGQRFLILSRDGITNDNLVWKDVALINMGETVDLLVPMENLGKWMAHCHIGEHLTSGMMMNFDVVE